MSKRIRDRPSQVTGHPLSSTEMCRMIRTTSHFIGGQTTVGSESPQVPPPELLANPSKGCRYLKPPVGIEPTTFAFDTVGGLGKQRTTIVLRRPNFVGLSGYTGCLRERPKFQRCLRLHMHRSSWNAMATGVNDNAKQK